MIWALWSLATQADGDLSFPEGPEGYESFMSWARSGAAEPRELDRVLRSHPWISKHPQALEILAELAHQGLLTWEFDEAFSLFKDQVRGGASNPKQLRKAIPYRKKGFVPPPLEAKAIAATRAEFLKDPTSITNASRHLTATGVAHTLQGQMIVISVHGDSPFNRHARSLFIQYGIRIVYSPIQMEKQSAGAYFDSSTLTVGTSRDAIAWGKPSDPLHMHELVHLADWLKMINGRPSAYLGEIEGQEGKSTIPLAFNDQTESYRDSMTMSELNAYRFEIGRMLDLLVRRRGYDPVLWDQLKIRLRILEDLSGRARESFRQMKGLFGRWGRTITFSWDPTGHLLTVRMSKRSAYDYAVEFPIPTEPHMRSLPPEQIFQEQLRLTEQAIEDARLLANEGRRLMSMIRNQTGAPTEEALPVLRAMRSLFRKRIQPGYPGYRPLEAASLREESNLPDPPNWRRRALDCVRSRLGLGQR